jgi:hypothetical protein
MAPAILRQLFEQVRFCLREYARVLKENLVHTQPAVPVEEAQHDPAQVDAENDIPLIESLIEGASVPQ